MSLATPHARQATQGPCVIVWSRPLELRLAAANMLSDGSTGPHIAVQYASGSLCIMVDAATSASLARRRAIRR
eukprot:6551304-Prymnesium_polylepis.1